MRNSRMNHDAMFNVGNKHIDTGIPQTQRKAAVDCVRLLDQSRRIWACMYT